MTDRGALVLIVEDQLLARPWLLVVQVGQILRAPVDVGHGKSDRRGCAVRPVAVDRFVGEADIARLAFAETEKARGIETKGPIAAVEDFAFARRSEDFE